MCASAKITKQKVHEPKDQEHKSHVCELKDCKILKIITSPVNELKDCKILKNHVFELEKQSSFSAQ